MSFRGAMSTVLLVVSYVVLLIVLLFSVSMQTAYAGPIMLVCIVGIVLLALFAMLHAGESDYVQARQSDRTLDLASKTLPFLSQGLDASSAQEVCDLLLPATGANAVSITDCEKFLGYAGTGREERPSGFPIQSRSTRDTLDDAQTRIVSSDAPNGWAAKTGLHTGIVAALVADKHVVGTLKFYYRSARKLNETQKAMAEGFAQLLSTQLSMSYLQQKTELAAQMELRALQAQINPHFLFNTINTIAATVRTDPDKARTMLREFAVYYRRLLENSEDLIMLMREVEQTERYLMFQRARFGEDSIEMSIEVEPGLERLKVPSFIMQPIVENAVVHGRGERGALHIGVRVYHASDSVIISIADDGVGIEPGRLSGLLEGGSETGMGIALKNVNARLKACFGNLSGLHIESSPGEGTTVYLTLHDALLSQRLDDDDEDEEEIQQVIFSDDAAIPFETQKMSLSTREA